MSKSKIPQYHPSYTEEENQQMYGKRKVLLRCP